MSWSDFIRSHMAVMAGIDFFTIEVPTWRGLATYCVLFFPQLETRRVILAGTTTHPTEEWMVQMARQAVDDVDGSLPTISYVLHNRDSKFCAAFQKTLRSGGVLLLVLPARSPNLNAFAERWVRSLKSEYLSKLILFGEGSLRRAATEFISIIILSFRTNGKGTSYSSPLRTLHHRNAQVPLNCHERLGGLLRFYQRAA